MAVCERGPIPSRRTVSEASEVRRSALAGRFFATSELSHHGRICQPLAICNHGRG